MDLNLDFKNKVEDNENKCINCKLCFYDCPMMKEFESSPKDLMNRILDESINLRKVAYSCMLCGLCTSKCPKGVDLKSMFYEIRKYLILNNENEVKKDGYKVVRFHQINSFSPLFSKSKNLKNSKAVFLPGCSLSSYSQDIVLKTYKYLNTHYENIGITFKCCSKPTIAMVDIEKFNKYYSGLEKEIHDEGIEEIIVACPNCYNTISKNSKDIKVISIYEVIEKFGIPSELKNNYKNLDFAIHDSCSVRNESNIHESVRSILRQLGANIIEFENNRENTVCCGAGGMVGVTNKNLALKQMKNRGYETNCKNIVCYCESCCESLLNCDKNILHILDLLFNENFIDHKKLTQSKSSTVDKWKMRYKTVKLSK